MKLGANGCHEAWRDVVRPGWPVGWRRHCASSKTCGTRLRPVGRRLSRGRDSHGHSGNEDAVGQSRALLDMAGAPDVRQNDMLEGGVGFTNVRNCYFFNSFKSYSYVVVLLNFLSIPKKIHYYIHIFPKEWGNW